MPKFGLFRKKKEEEQKQEQPTTEPTIEETPKEETPNEKQRETLPTTQEPLPTPNEEGVKTYLKAMPLRELTDIETIKTEIQNGNIIILRITPLASKSIDDVKTAVDQLYAFTESIHGDIARLGEERIVICPENIRIWREKTPTQNQNAPLPTAT